MGCFSAGLNTGTYINCWVFWKAQKHIKKTSSTNILKKILNYFLYKLERVVLPDKINKHIGIVGSPE